MATELLSTKGLSKHFAGVRALDGIDFTLDRGSVRGLIGPNGSGKTTFINLVSGLLAATAGEIMFVDSRIDALAAKDRTKLGIARTFQMARVMEQMSCQENVMVGSYCRTGLNLVGTYLRIPLTRSSQERAIRTRSLELLDFVGLGESRDRMAADLVWVERQLLQIARALATEPTLLLLDEPTAGMGGAESRHVESIIAKIRNMGITVVLVSHDVKLVARVVDYITVINSGTMLAEGTPAAVQCDPRVIEAYLGSEQQAYVLTLQDVAVSYGHIEALRGVDLRVDEGELVVLVGSNGAGKSTVMNAVVGVAPTRQGKITYLGQDITRRPTDRIIAAGVAVVPEGRGVLPLMSVIENLQLGGYHVRRKKDVARGIDSVLERFPILAQRRDQVAGTLSGGQQQILAIARALVSSPRLLLVDEPSIGLAPLMVDEVFDVLTELRQNKQTILLSEQNARKSLAHADRGYVLDLGKTVLEGTSAQLIQNEDVCRAYLGGAD